MQKAENMTMAELYEHCLNHPDHNGPVQIASLGVSFAKRWHFQQHLKDLNHDHEE